VCLLCVSHSGEAYFCGNVLAPAVSLAVIAFEFGCLCACFFLKVQGTCSLEVLGLTIARSGMKRSPRTRTSLVAMVGCVDVVVAVVASCLIGLLE
jgi:hypothetical protein